MEIFVARYIYWQLVFLIISLNVSIYSNETLQSANVNRCWGLNEEKNRRGYAEIHTASGQYYEILFFVSIDRM